MNDLMEKAELLESKENAFCVFKFCTEIIWTSVKHYCDTDVNVIQKPIFSLPDFLQFGIITTCLTYTKGTNYLGTSLRMVATNVE